MIRKWMRRSVVSNQSVAGICSVACSIAGAAVLVLGFRRFEQLEFNQAQLYLATIGTLLLAGCFVVLAMIFHLWRKAA